MLRFVLSCLLLATAVLAADAPHWPAPAPSLDDSRDGWGIQRTMRLLATSTPEHRNTVRVLFYGQSITEQSWARLVGDWLKAQYPNANLIVENRAIGGFSSQVLVKTAEQDLYPFYPDLMIFYVFGSHIEYENIIRRTRERTTAEILMQNDHVTNEKELTEETDPAKLPPRGDIWSAFMNHNFLPATARKYGCELVDQRSEWKRYLQANGLKPVQLTIDGTHLNDQGNYLMAELVKRHLRYRPDLGDAPSKGLVLDELEPGTERTLDMAFDGNRVDAVWDDGAGAATVTIDGRKPSEIKELWAMTRTTGYPGVGWPCVMRVRSNVAPVAEEWSIKLTDMSDDLKTFRFSVSGSVTGPDGEGRATEKFVSKSGRVVIDPDDWSVARSREFTKKPLPADFVIRWRAVPQFVERYEPRNAGDPAIEHTITLAQGLKNGHHTVVLTTAGDRPPALTALRFYRPPLADTER